MTNPKEPEDLMALADDYAKHNLKVAAAMDGDREYAKEVFNAAVESREALKTALAAQSQALEDALAEVERLKDAFTSYKLSHCACEFAEDDTPVKVCEIHSALRTRCEALEKDAARLDLIAIHGTFGVDSVTGEVGGNGQTRKAATRKNIDAALLEKKV
jgi:hypothetical protein